MVAPGCDPECCLVMDERAGLPHNLCADCVHILQWLAGIVVALLHVIELHLQLPALRDLDA